MQNLTNSASTAIETSVAAAEGAATQVPGVEANAMPGEGVAMEDAGGVAVLTETTTATATETALDTAVQQAVEETVAPTPFDVRQPIEYTRQELMDARTYVLLVKRSGKNAGFGAKSGPMIRDTIGYKFDSMDIMDALAEMAKPDFLTRYAATIEKWHGGLKKDGVAPATLKANDTKKADALALSRDTVAFQKLVRSLQILCQRNQDWRESGSNISLPYNGHKAVLDLLGIQVTNNRRLGLTMS